MPRNPQKSTGSHRLAGHRAPDLSLHQHMPLRRQRLHGFGAPAHQGIHAQPALHALGTHHQRCQKEGNGAKCQAH